jgi:hypothetical protein
MRTLDIAETNDVSGGCFGLLPCLFGGLFSWNFCAPAPQACAPQPAPCNPAPAPAPCNPAPAPCKPARGCR